jgi:hypothetical protein
MYTRRKINKNTTLADINSAASDVGNLTAKTRVVERAPMEVLEQAALTPTGSDYINNLVRLELARRERNLLIDSMFVTTIGGSLIAAAIIQMLK